MWGWVSCVCRCGCECAFARSSACLTSGHSCTFSVTSAAGPPSSFWESMYDKFME